MKNTKYKSMKIHPCFCKIVCVTIATGTTNPQCKKVDKKHLCLGMLQRVLPGVAGTCSRQCPGVFVRTSGTRMRGWNGHRDVSRRRYLDESHLLPVFMVYGTSSCLEINVMHNYLRMRYRAWGTRLQVPPCWWWGWTIGYIAPLICTLLHCWDVFSSLLSICLLFYMLSFSAECFCCSAERFSSVMHFPFLPSSFSSLPSSFSSLPSSFSSLQSSF